MTFRANGHGLPRVGIGTYPESEFSRGRGTLMRRNLSGPLLISLFLSSAATASTLGPDYVDVLTLPQVAVDLRYASTNNFMGEDLYGEFRTAYLHQVAFAKLKAASAELKRRQPRWKLLVFDALRPRSVQRRLWDRVKGTEKEEYVANPDKGSIHNFGFAVDLSLMNERGQEVDMGTEFDNFTDLAQPVLEEQMVRAGRLTRTQVNHRKILRAAMQSAGFKNIRNEWWHFDALPSKTVRDKYKIVE
jgi:D-alanyl-D-alanine dipeptidase